MLPEREAVYIVPTNIILEHYFTQQELFHMPHVARVCVQSVYTV